MTDKEARKQSAERRDIIQQMTILQSRIINADLPITARAFHNAVRAIGWEISGDIKKAAEYAK